MQSKNVTLTSKNQITLPIEYVRHMQLSQKRILHVQMRGESIILTPKPMLGETIQQFWGKHHAKKTLTDTEIKQAIRTSSVTRIIKTL